MNETLPPNARDELLALYDEVQDELEVNDLEETAFLTHVAKKLHSILFPKLVNTLAEDTDWDLVIDDGDDVFDMYTEEGDAAVLDMLTKIRGDVTSRNVVADAVKEDIDIVGEAHPEVYDLEPQIAIADWVNKHVCLPNGWEPFLVEEL